MWCLDLLGITEEEEYSGGLGNVTFIGDLLGITEEEEYSEGLGNVTFIGDLLGITEEEEYSEGLGNVTFQDGRYKVELPFKEGHPIFCSGLKGRRPFWLLNPPSRGGS